MAKKKKRSAPRRRRRISGFGAGMGERLMNIAAIGVGVVAGKMITDKIGASMDVKTKSGIAAVGGLLLASKTSGILSALATGISVGAVVDVAKQQGLISGIGAPSVTFSQQALGYPNMPVVNGVNDPYQTMNGFPEMSVISGVEDYMY